MSDQLFPYVPSLEGFQPAGFETFHLLADNGVERAARAIRPEGGLIRLELWHGWLTLDGFAPSPECSPETGFPIHGEIRCFRPSPISLIGPEIRLPTRFEPINGGA